MKTPSQYFLKRVTIVYLLTLISCSILFSRRIMPWYAFISGIASIAVFHALFVNWEKAWRSKDDKRFERAVFLSALLLRLFWIFLFYEFTSVYWDTPWEQPIGTSMDSFAYYDEAVWAKEMFDIGQGEEYFNYLRHRLSDAGYPLLLIV